MNTAHLFAGWLYQKEKPTLDPATIETFAYSEIDHLPVRDLIVALYYGRSGHAMVALNALKRHFHDEMSRLEELTYPREMT
jgi:hypothetical protein